MSGFNPTGEGRSRRLRIENSWLDHLDVYFVKDDRLIGSYHAGDRQPFGNRPIPGRFFSFDNDFDVGATEIYLRVATPDPIVVPIFLLSPADAAQRDEVQGYSYGFVYGYQIALLAYNILLYLSLRHRRHLLYAAFMAMFVLMNLAYTGHGFAWLWPDHVTLQNWIIPVLMVLFGSSGLAFAKHFLDTRSNFPHTHKIVSVIQGLFVVLLTSSIVADSQLTPFWRPSLS